MSRTEAGRQTEDEPEMTREILRYFVRNPQAADSLEGVTRWRLLQDTVQRQLENTQRALNWLVSRGFLRQVSNTGNAPIFSLNPERQAEARRFLNPGGRTRPVRR
jgi:hypothetical protein